MRNKTSDVLQIKAEGGATYEKKTLLNIARIETDTSKLCELKYIRKRSWFFGEKVTLVHWKGNDDYYIKDL